MNILYQILAVSGVLFVLAMVFICLGLFKKPKIKPEGSTSLNNFSGSSSGRSLDNVGAEGDYDEYGADTDEPEDYYDEDYDDVSDEENEDTEESEELEGTGDNEAEETDGEDNSSSGAENETAASSPAGIHVSVTIIDTNKTTELVVENEALIGRNPSCDVVVAKPMVSSVHCLLINENNKLMAEDNNSTNGTLLNGKPLKHIVELKNNDILTLGDRQIRINFE